MDRTGITIGMPQVYVTITFRNASTHPMTITSVRAAFMDNDQRNFTQTFTGEQALVLPPKKAQSLDFKTNGYALDPESATLSVTILHDKRLVAGPFDVTIAQTLPSESREKEKKRREAIDAIDRRR